MRHCRTEIVVCQSVSGVWHSGRVSHRGKDEMKERKEREKHTKGVSGRSVEARCAEEKRTVPLVRAGRWRLGHAWQSSSVFFFFF